MLEIISEINRIDNSKWTNFRNECLFHMCSRNCSRKFSEEFIKLINKYDHSFVKDNDQFLDFLTNWRDKRKNLESLVETICGLHLQYTSSNSLSIYIRLLTENLLDDRLSEHGSSLVIMLTKSFKHVCKETSDYEILFILWKKLFQR